jgi:hypothetical protein
MPDREHALERLEYLRGEIEAEQISYSELSELANLTEFIDPSDVVLLQWAGVPEFDEKDDGHEWLVMCPYCLCEPMDATNKDECYERIKQREEEGRNA